MIYTFVFANSTMENLRVTGSIDITTAIFLFFVAISFFVSFLALYFSHLRGVSIFFSSEYELPELQADDFKMDVPTSLPLKVSLLVLNSGNRAGVVKNLDLKFNPQSDFEEFYRNNEIKWFSIKSAKTNQPASTILVKDRDTDLVIFSGFINLDWDISMRHPLRTLDIESENLTTLLKEMLEYKKELLKKFITFLTKNEKLGDLIISYSYTRPKLIFLPFIKFKKKDNPLELRHSYTETIKCYEDCLKNYQLYPHPTKIIENTLKEIDKLKGEFERYYNNIEENSGKDLFVFNIDSHFIKNCLNKENEEIGLLSKCRDYRKIIEEDVKPLFKAIMNFNQKTEEAYETHSKVRKQSLIEDLKGDREPLRKRLIEMSSKLENLKKGVEHELKEIDLRII